MEDIIHTQRSSYRALPFVGAGLGIILGALVLIGLYGRGVGMISAVRDVRNELALLNEERAAMQQQIVELTGSEHLRTLAHDLSLVEDKAPEYFKTGNQWAAALPF